MMRWALAILAALFLVSVGAFGHDRYAIYEDTHELRLAAGEAAALLATPFMEQKDEELELTARAAESVQRTLGGRAFADLKVTQKRTPAANGATQQVFVSATSTTPLRNILGIAPTRIDVASNTFRVRQPQ